MKVINYEKYRKLYKGQELQLMNTFEALSFRIRGGNFIHMGMKSQLKLIQTLRNQTFYLALIYSLKINYTA